jgi:hypothetical protein
MKAAIRFWRGASGPGNRMMSGSANKLKRNSVENEKRRKRTRRRRVEDEKGGVDGWIAREYIVRVFFKTSSN